MSDSQKNDDEGFQFGFSVFDENTDGLFAEIKRPSKLATDEIATINVARKEVREAPDISDTRVKDLLEIIQKSLKRLKKDIESGHTLTESGWDVNIKRVNDGINSMRKIIEPRK